MVCADVPKFLGIFWGECCWRENGNCIFGRMAKIQLFFRRIVLSGDYKNLFSPPIYLLHHTLSSLSHSYDASFYRSYHNLPQSTEFPLYSLLMPGHNVSP